MAYHDGKLKKLSYFIYDGVWILQVVFMSMSFSQGTPHTHTHKRLRHRYYAW